MGATAPEGDPGIQAAPDIQAAAAAAILKAAGAQGAAVTGAAVNQLQLEQLSITRREL